MVENTKTPIISISTGEAVRNVKELKDNIKALKEQLDNVETSTDDYSDIVKQLSQNQAALRNVMNGVNSTFNDSIEAAQGLGTSYNSLVQQLKQATQEWRTIPKYLSDADQATGRVNQAWTTAAQKVYDLRTQLKNMDADTNSFVRNVGNYKSALDGFSGSMGQVKQIGGDMVNGIQAAASTFAMLGLNADGLNDSMKNLRIVLAAVQGAKGFSGLISKLGSYFKAGRQAVQVTNQQTVALDAEAAAQTTANAATEAGTVAMNGLQKALIATGIGALVVGLGMLVAHFEDIVKWVGKVGEKFGLWKTDTESVKGVTDKLNNKIEEQNHALDNQQKLLKAQGVENGKLLRQKKELTIQQINETKAAIENVKARIEQLKADDRWWKFWQRTKGKIAEANEELEGLEETLKNLNRINTDIDVDIQVDAINQGNKAAEKARKEVEKAMEVAQKLVDKGVETVKKINQANETELEKIVRENKENVDTIKAAIKATETLTGVTKEQVELLKNGLVAESTRYAEVLKDYYRKNYEKKAEQNYAKLTKQKESEYEEDVRIERIMKNVLGLTESQVKKMIQATAERRRDFDILKEQVDLIKKDIEPDMLAIAPKLKTMTEEEIRKEFGEPLATALITMFQTEDKLKLAGEEVAREILEGYETAIEKSVENGQVDTAQILLKNLTEEVSRLFGSDESESIRTLADEYIAKFTDFVTQAVNDYEPPKNNLFKDIFGGFDENGKKQLQDMREELQKLRDEGKEASDEFVTLNEKAAALSMKLWDNYFSKLGKHFNTYGKSTAALLDNVADAWEATLQVQVKTHKKTEEEAKNSFEKMKVLQYASAIIGTAGAVVQALADPTIPSYYVKAINAAAALAAGTAQVLKIRNTEFSGSAGDSTAETPRLVQQAPTVSYTVGLNADEYAQAAAATPVRAYVVDKDLADGLDEYNQRQEETTF